MLDPKQDCGYYHTNFELKLPFYQAEDEILIDSTVPGGLLANFFFATY